MLLPVLTGAVYLLDGHPHYAALDEVLDSDLLTHLYGTSVRIVTTPQGDMFVTPVSGRTTRRPRTPTTPSSWRRCTAMREDPVNGIQFAFDPNWLDTLSAPFMTNAFLAGSGHIPGRRRDGLLHHRTTLHLRRACPGPYRAARGHRRGAARPAVSLGLGVFALGGALVIGALGKRASQREIATGTVLAFATGLGLFFARLSSSASQQMQSILFGSILTITTGQIIGFLVFDVILLAVLAVIYRPLLFSSLDEQVAQAKGVPIA